MPNPDGTSTNEEHEEALSRTKDSLTRTFLGEPLPVARTEEEAMAANEEMFALFAEREVPADALTPEHLREQTRLVVVDGIKELQLLLDEDAPLTAVAIILVPEAEASLVRMHVAGDVLAVAIGLNSMLMANGVSPVELLGGVQSLLKNFAVRSGYQAPDVSGDKNLN